MKKNLFLTSMFVIVGMNVAIADDDYITSQSMCTVDVLNTYGGENGETAQLEADWELLSIACPAGQYLSKTTGECESCLENNFCLGGTFDVEMANTGLTDCSTVENGAYPYSFIGASANTGCYRSCTTSDVAHSTGVKGRYFYGDTNNCSATGCAAGWKIKNVGLSGGDSAWVKGNPAVSGGWESEGDCITGAVINSVYSGSISTKYIGTGDATNNEYKNNSNFYYYDDRGYRQPSAAYFGLDSNAINTWAVEHDVYGSFKAIGSCNNTAGTSPMIDGNNQRTNTETYDIQPDGKFSLTSPGTGTHCWCQLTNYKAKGANSWETKHSDWVYIYATSNKYAYYDGYLTCGQCGYACMGLFLDDVNFRSFMISSAGLGRAICDSSTIFLDWYNDTVANGGTKITVQEEAQQCLYDSTITVPDQAHTPNKTGYTFGGWKLRTNN